MARLWHCGFELNTTSADVEYSGNSTGGTPAGTIAVGTAYARSGLYGCQCKIAGTGQWANINLLNFAAEINFFCVRFNVNIQTMPNWTTGKTFINFLDNGFNKRIYTNLNIDGTITLLDEDGTIGTSALAMKTGHWYLIEIKMDRTGAAGSHIVELKMADTVQVTSSTRSLSIGCNRFWVGFVEGSSDSTQGEMWMDDFAFNDNTGANQTNYPGPGNIISLPPIGTGESNQWNNTANGAGSANNYQLVDEIAPNDATDLVQSGTLNDIDFYKSKASDFVPIGQINVVAIGMRFRNNTADATTAFRVRAEKVASGTVSESASIIPNSTTWKTNAIATPWLYPLVLYSDPDGNAWTLATLDSMQIGVKLTAANVNRIQVSTIWAMVDCIIGIKNQFSKPLRPKIFAPGHAR